MLVTSTLAPLSTGWASSFCGGEENRWRDRIHRVRQTSPLAWDVTAPKNPRPVNYLPTPPNTWALHLQTHDDLLLVVNAVNLFASSLYANEVQYYTRSVVAHMRMLLALSKL